MQLNEQIKSLVKKHFSLGDEGFSDFVRITEKQLNNLPEEYSFLEHEKELRKFFRIPIEMLEYIDEGYSVLKSLNSFCSEYKISFKDYYENKKNVDKQSIKLFKLINDFYNNLFDEAASHCGVDVNYDVSYELCEDVAKHSRKLNDLFECFRKYYKPSERDSFRRMLSDKGIKLSKDIIQSVITKIFEKIGSFKIKSEDDLYFVISKNPNDYFLSSYEKGWTSCLNPESVSGLWSCLPFVIADKGRCILYITDMSPKEYMNIKSYSMLKRSWGIVGETDGMTKIFSQIFYPSKTIIENDFFQRVGISDRIENIKEGFISKYPLDLFYNVFGIYDYLYQDNTYFIHGKDGRIILKHGSHNHNIIKYDDYDGLSILKMKWFNEGHTLSELVSNGKELVDFADKRFCRECHSYGNTLSIRQGDEYLNICNRCLKKYIQSQRLKCSCCSSAFTEMTDIFETYGEILCRSCFTKKTKKKHNPNMADMESMVRGLQSSVRLSLSDDNPYGPDPLGLISHYRDAEEDHYDDDEYDGRYNDEEEEA